MDRSRTGARVVETHSPEETHAWGCAFARLLTPGACVGLDGPLGAGKSVLVRGIAAGLGVAGPVPSPTYTLLSVLAGRGGLPVCHFDLYRIATPAQLAVDDVEPYFNGDGVALIEWAERAGDLLPAGAWRVGIEIVSESARRITVTEPVGYAAGDR